jgi:hypothetical protein
MMMTLKIEKKNRDKIKQTIRFAKKKPSPSLHSQINEKEKKYIVFDIVALEQEFCFKIFVF